MIILIFISVLLAFAPLVIIFREQKGVVSKKKLFEHYPQNVNDKGTKLMRDTKTGIVRKQLLENDAPVYSSGRSLKQYKSFLQKNSIQEKISGLSGSRYNG